MEPNFFSIGDIVSLKTHPYLEGNTDIIISGDHIMLTPLMVIIEIYKSKQHFASIKTDIYKYKCTWFSPKSYKFILAEIDEIDLKLVVKSNSPINEDHLNRGDKVVFKTANIELGKKKSLLNYADNSIDGGVGSSLINSLFSFLPPVMQVVNFEPHKSKHPLIDKNLLQIRIAPSINVKFSYFDPTYDKISIHTLPIDALELIEQVKEETIISLTKIIRKEKYLIIKTDLTKTIAKPHHIAYRSGYYYLTFYNYLLNKVEETQIKSGTTYELIKNSHNVEVPKFDIAHEPEAATPQFIIKEIVSSIINAKDANAFLRIKYKNRNNQLSYRTIKEYDIVIIGENSLTVSYLIGYCLKRKAKRSFRIDRIQNLQQLNLSFK